MSELTTKQKLFVEAYLANPNATEAAKRAGYSEKTARQQGQRMLSNVVIQEKLKVRVEEAIITANEILTDVKQIAKTADKDSDKLKAYEMLGKHLAMWTDKTENTNDVTQRILVEFTDDGLE